MAGPRSPFPIPSEPSIRRLGVGSSGSAPGGGDRPLRAQIVVAACVLLVLVAVPLYLLRKPSPSAADQASASASVPLLGLAFDAGKPTERVRLGAVQRHECSASPSARGQEGAMCDRLPFFEEALAKAIRDTTDCAPETDQAGSINYALSINFRGKKLKVFPGASGDWSGPQAKRAARCVLRTLPPPAWESIRHRHQYYLLSILATYPMPQATETPNFK